VLGGNAACHSHCSGYLFVLAKAILLLCAFVVLDLVSSLLNQQIDWEEHQVINCHCLSSCLLSAP